MPTRRTESDISGINARNFHFERAIRIDTQKRYSNMITLYPKRVSAIARDVSESRKPLTMIVSATPSEDRNARIE